jgi:plasmid stabilization system protein ParE
MTPERIILSRPASDDLDRIWDYLTSSASAEIADFVIARLFEAMNRAAELPLMYQRTKYRGGPRRINIFEYAIFYEPQQEGNGIVVWRITHGRRDLARLIRGPSI